MGEYKQSSETDVWSLTAVTSSGVAYTTGDCIGGKLTFSDQTDAAKCTSGIVTALTIIDKNKQSANYDFYLFDTEPLTSSFTDNASFGLVAGDLDKLCPGTPVRVNAQITDGANGYTMVDGLSIPFRCRVTPSLYGCLVSAGSTPTFTSTSAILARLGIIQD
jgi:hypothetical protein